MSRQKGNALCHTYTNIGRHNHQQMDWESTKKQKCDHHRYIGKRSICLFDKATDCKDGNPQNCKLELFHRKCVHLNTEGTIVRCGFDFESRVCHQLTTHHFAFECPIGKYTVAPE